MYYLAVLFLLSICQAQHDHSKHVDVDFIKSEARRLAWHQLDDMVKYIKEYSDTIRFIEKKYEDYFRDPDPDDSERVRLENIWKEHFEPSFRDTYDRVLIISSVCKDLYNNDAGCEIEDDIWNDKYDLRGREFRDEFLEEIHKAVEDDVQRVKASRRDFNPEIDL